MDNDSFMTTDVFGNNVDVKKNAYVWKIDAYDNTIRRKLTCVKSNMKPNISQSRKIFIGTKCII